MLITEMINKSSKVLSSIQSDVVVDNGKMNRLLLKQQIEILKILKRLTIETKGSEYPDIFKDIFK